VKRRISETVRAHPVLAISLVLCIALGVFAAFVLLPEDWSGLRRSAAGIIGGAGVWLLMTAPRLVG
jgi:hypothetical protein